MLGINTNDNTPKEPQCTTPKRGIIKKWNQQSFSEKLGTVFHLIGTKDGWNKIIADYNDGKLDGYVNYNGVNSNGKQYGGRDSIFTREK